MSESINPRRLAIEVLIKTFSENSFADYLLGQAFQRYTLTKDERRLIIDIVYGTLCWQGKIDWMLQQTYTSDWDTLPRLIKYILATAVYQILYMDDITTSEAVKEAAAIAVTEKGLIWGRTVNFVLLETERKNARLTFPDMKKNPAKAIATLWSHPEWAIEKWIDRFGIERTLSICVANNQKFRGCVRINPLIGTVDDTVERLKTEQISLESCQWLDNFFLTEDAGELFVSSAYREGLFNIQNISEGFVSLILDPREDEFILDMTAAPGNKTMHLAELSHDKAYIIAVDRHPGRTRLMQNYVTRYPYAHIFPVMADSRRPPVSQVDKILIDAPSTGLGAMGHLGELKWRRKPEDLNKLIKLQSALLHAGAQSLKTDGILVYAASSIMREETEDVIETFLEEHSDFVIIKPENVPEAFITDEGYFQTWPDRDGLDAVFAVKLMKIK